jgi:dihydroorotate dehydrogenase (NAD+) catalytic subunit
VTGGLSGPAIKPITMRLVYEASRAVRIPVIGLGGIEKAEDVLEYLIAGASAAQVGTANFTRPDACAKLVDSVEKTCIDLNIPAISNLRGSFKAESS